MMKCEVFIFLISTMCLAGCNGKAEYRVINEGVIANDSTMLRDSGYVTIQIGDKITPAPYSSEIVNMDGIEVYSLLDENQIHFFPLWVDSVPSASLKLKDYDNLNNYSGYRYINKDSVIIYDYKNRELSIYDSVSDGKRIFKIEDPDENVYPRAISSTPIIYAYPYVVLSGCRFGHPDDMYGDEFHTSVRIDLRNNDIKYIGKYPDGYAKGDFGGVYMNEIFQTTEENGGIMLSFPASHQVYRMNTHTNNIDSLYMGSRYAGFIESSVEDALDLLVKKDLRIEYYISQHSYSKIVYDSYRKVYYRIAEHPLDKWDGGRFSKPFSIIVMTEKGEVLTETPVLIDSDKLNTWNMHVCSRGLMIQETSENENEIKFKLFSLEQ